MPARLIYVAGPSGSGKDALLRYARERIGGEPAVAFAHRYITRPAHPGGENHVALTRSEFDARRRRGLFALAWERNGHAYGVGIEIDDWLAKGVAVVVNGSRRCLHEARRRHPQLVAVLIDAPPDVLRRRLFARGREDAQAIERRLATPLVPCDDATYAHVIVNDRPLQRAGDRLLALIAAYA